MTFQPRMTNRIRGFSVVGDLQRRQWKGIIADVWDVECAPFAGGHYVSTDPRLFVVLEARGGHHCGIELSDGNGDEWTHVGAQAMTYVPADMPLRAQTRALHFVRHLDMHFDIDVLRSRFEEDFDPHVLATPRLTFSDARVLALANLVADECISPQPLHDLYGDGLAIALFASLMNLQPPHRQKRSLLAAWQVRRTTEFIKAQCLRNIRLEELAALAGLSQSHFSHAFKASTGRSPHDWQMNARIGLAKGMIRSGEMTLTAIAAETGFSDQAHFTRVFRKCVGTTPARWKKTGAP